MRKMLIDDRAGLPVVLGAIIVVAVLILGVMAYVYVTAEDDEFVPTVDVTFTRRSTTNDYYDADIEMEVDEPSFLEYWYSASVLDPGFPEGDHSMRLLITYEWYDEDGTLQTGTLFDKLWEEVGVHSGEMSERTYTFTIPDLKRPPPHRSNENAVLWVMVFWDGGEIGKSRFVVNYSLLEVDEA